MKYAFWIILILTGSLFTTGIHSQEVINLRNPSFEDVPHKGGEYSAFITGWVDCGLSIFPGETPPDIHPVKEKAWEVSMAPAHGKTYLGLVTRYNDSHESVSQKLRKPLVKGKCYSVSVYLAQSPDYLSPTARSPEISENYTYPIVFVMGAGYALCKNEQILAESNTIGHHEWRKYEFTFQANDNYGYIILQAYYDLPILAPYNGHVLVDGLSAIVEVDCK